MLRHKTIRARFVVHPHTRGEHAARICGSATGIGSSPHTWGTLGVSRGRGLRGRFIPTHVGNTPLLIRDRRQISVHPHTRGEHATTGAIRVPAAGSSPHTWGTRMDPHGIRYRDRFIPTHVGNTRRSCRRKPARTVHPHTRGEHSRSSIYQFSIHGSSPHTWGTLHQEGVDPTVGRFIPTHVGNTRWRAAAGVSGSVHPHTRGEHPGLPGLRVRGLGSSPHTWGTPKREFSDGYRARFIPTHVGNTE